MTPHSTGNRYPAPAARVALGRAEREAVERVMGQTQGDTAEATAILGIVRPSLYRIMRRYGIATPAQTKE